MRRILYGGAIWNCCDVAPIEELEEPTVEDVAEQLWWLPPERARAIAERLLFDEDADLVLAGWVGTQTGLVADPPEDAEEIDTSREGDPVYLLSGDEPDFIYDDLDGEVFEPYYVALGRG